MDHAARRRRLAERLDEAGLDGLLVAASANVRYLSGFTGSNGWLVTVHDRPVLVTDGRYAEQAAHEAGGIALEVTGGPMAPAAVAAAAGAGVRRLGFESGMSFASYGRLQDVAAPGGVELVAVDGAVEALRMRKDADELALMRRAQACADAAFDAVLRSLGAGITEREAELELVIAMRRAGADDAAFEGIVAFGEGSAEPHHRAGNRALRSGDVVKLDFGALVDGYRSDMTRTVSLGEPPEALRRAHQVVAEANAAGTAALVAGSPAGAAEAAARAVVERAGLAGGWLHPPGHGIGLDVHEAPILRRDEPTEVPPDAVITMEPGVYLPGVGGVRIEDMVLVGEKGPETMAGSTKGLVVL